MNSCLDTLNELDGWADDFEIEELPSVPSATIIIVVVVVAHLPVGIRPPLTSVPAPT